jgi:hypothetical protein
MVNDGTGKGRQRTCSRRDNNVLFTRRSIERRDAGNEVARIGEIDVVRTRLDAGARNMVGLTLKRAGRMDDQIGTKIAKPGSKVLRRVVDRAWGAIRGNAIQLADEVRCRREIPSRYYERDVGIVGQCATDASAKISVTTEDNDPKLHGCIGKVGPQSPAAYFSWPA